MASLAKGFNRERGQGDGVGCARRAPLGRDVERRIAGRVNGRGAGRWCRQFDRRRDIGRLVGQTTRANRCPRPAGCADRNVRVQYEIHGPGNGRHGQRRGVHNRRPAQLDPQPEGRLS